MPHSPKLSIRRTMAALPALAFAAAYAADAPPPIVKEGRTVKISPHVYVIPDEHVPMVPNVGFVVGTKAALVVDPGMGRPSGEIVLRELQKVSKTAEIYVVNTHFHPEHTTGDVAFPPGAKVVRATAQQQDVEEMGMKMVENFAGRTPVIADVLKGASFRAPAETFETEKTLDLGGVRVRLMRLGPGHTRGDTAFYVEGDGVLFSGDLAMRNIFPAFATPQSSARSWLTSLDALDKLKATRVVPAHGDMTDATVIDAYRGYLKALQSRVAELKKQGKSSDEAAVELRAEFAQKYPGWAQPLRVHPAVTVIYKELP